MANNTISFATDEVELLYCIPQPGGDLPTILWTFGFINRSAPPAFSLLQACLTKALQAGMLSANKGHYKIEPVWYDRIHMFDATEANEIESMLAFQDEFVGVELPVLITGQVDLSEQAYQAALEELQNRW